jgi:hypothetical protein
LAGANADPEQAVVTEETENAPQVADEISDGDAGEVGREVATVVGGSDGCSLTVESQPAGAAIKVGETEVGETPYSGAAPCGAVLLEVRRPRYAPITQEVELTPAKPLSLAFDLVRPMVKLRIISSPAVASVRINGEEVGATPVTVEVPAYEQARVQLRKDGFLVWNKSLAPKDKRTVVKATLKKRR